MQGGEGSFTLPQAAKLAKLSVRQVSYWANTGLIVPSIDPGGGTGFWKAFSFQDLIALRVASELRAGGVSLQRLRRVVSYLRRQGFPEPLRDTRLVIAGRDVVLCRGRELVSTLKAPGQALMYMVDYSALVEELRRKIA